MVSQLTLAGRLADEVGDKSSGKTWVAMASGLLMGAQEAPADLKAEMMVEWLTGESGGLEVCHPLAQNPLDLTTRTNSKGAV
jgi:hypothetical protein